MLLSKPRSRSLSLATGQVLGMPVGIALPVQRRDPRLVFALSAIELVAFAALLVTLSDVALVVTAIVGAGLLGMRAADQRRIVAITSSGVVVLAASMTGKPLVAVGPAPADLALPTPGGLGVPLRLGERTWWVDRAEFARLRRARQMLGDAATEPGGSIGA